MSEELKNSYVCPNCYCSDGWHVAGNNMKGDECLECQTLF